jgi:ADP-glucose pyrophosphorylase
MKAIIFSCFLLLSTTIFAQLSVSTNYRQDGVWNEETSSWDILSTDEKGTLFEFNKELTTFHHTTATISSDYYITKWEYNDEEVKYTMQIKSDVGNEYEMIIDGINNCVIFFYWSEGRYYMVRHTIKNSWFKE